MNRVIYSEHQRFRQVLWIWLIIIPVAFFTSLSIFYGFYQQVILGKPWGNEPMNDGGLTAMLLITIVVQALAIWIVASLQVRIEITQDELRYKLFAYFTNWTVLTRDQIKSYSVGKYTVWKGRGLGYKKDLFSKTARMIIKPGNILTLETTEGKTIMMSIENKEELERAMQKLISKSENF